VVLLRPAVGLERLLPGHDLRPALELRPTLAFRHISPDPEFGLVVQGVGEAFGDYRAAVQICLAICWAAPRTNRASS
jgi:hypothetical protein